MTETKDRHDKYYGDFVYTISFLTNWFTKFRCSRTSTCDTKSFGVQLWSFHQQQLKKPMILYTKSDAYYMA